MASQLSGLSTHVIRIWERRYGAMNPTRTDTNRRMFCEEAIRRLKLLRELTENGHRIGNVAQRPTDELQKLVDQQLQQTVSASACASTDTTPLESPHQFVDLCIEASKAYDGDKVRRVLLRARQHLGQRGMLHHVICPLIHNIGDAWQAGNLRPSHEHVATSVIREMLMTPVPGSQTAVNAPELIITTPSGETHELGAMLVAASARDLGWKVIYLGPNLPIEEIAACAATRRARAVALSVVYPERCAITEDKLRRMRQLLPEPMALIIGGRAAKGYQEQMPELNIHWAHSLNGLDQVLIQISVTR